MLNADLIVNILRIGIPSAGELLSYNTSQFLIMYFITTMGTDAITTNGLHSKYNDVYLPIRCRDMARYANSEA